MSGGNVTIGGSTGLPTTQYTVATGDSFPAWSATGNSTYQAFASMIADVVYAIPMTLIQSTATIAVAGVASLPSGPVGFISIQLNGNAVRIPYYSP